MTEAAFLSSPAARARFWARSTLGWPTMAGARPNGAHAALAALGRAGAVGDLITQNVDGLHAAAGSPRVLELHGSVHAVKCRACAALAPRAPVQARADADNAGWLARAAAARAAAAARPDGNVRDLDDGNDDATGGSVPRGAEGEGGAGAGERAAAAAAAAAAAVLRPDGDLESAAPTDAFLPPPCGACGARMLAPHVVFFGGALEPAVAARAAAAAEAAPAVLVAGTTLSTLSSLRLVRAAAARGARVVVVNRGATRADALPGVERFDADVGAVLAAAAGVFVGA